MRVEIAKLNTRLPGPLVFFYSFLLLFFFFSANVAANCPRAQNCLKSLCFERVTFALDECARAGCGLFSLLLGSGACQPCNVSLCVCICAACEAENKDCFVKSAVPLFFIFLQRSEASLVCRSNSKAMKILFFF